MHQGDGTILFGRIVRMAPPSNISYSYSYHQGGFGGAPAADPSPPSQGAQGGPGTSDAFINSPGEDGIPGDLLASAAKGVLNILFGEWACTPYRGQDEAKIPSPPPPPPPTPEVIQTLTCEAAPQWQIEPCGLTPNLKTALAQFYFLTTGRYCSSELIKAIAKDEVVTYQEFTGLIDPETKDSKQAPILSYAAPPSLLLSESLYLEVLLNWQTPTEARPDLKYRHFVNYLMGLHQGICEMYDARPEYIKSNSEEYFLYSNLTGARVKCGPHHPINESVSLNQSFKNFDKDGDEKIHRSETQMSESEFKRFQKKLDEFHRLTEEASCADESSIDPFEANAVHQAKLRLLKTGKIPCSSDCD